MVQRIVLIKDGYDVNGYFYVDKSTGRGYFFDPGAEAERIAEIIRKNGLIIEKIIITHGHFDHIGGAEELRSLISAPVFIHENGRLFLSDPHYNLSEFTGTGKISFEADGYFKDGDMISLVDGSLPLKVIHTPGHTDDSCVFYSEKESLAFTGDTIFKGTYGNPRFPTGNEALLIKNIREKVLTLPDETVLYSGHTKATTVKDERPFYRV